MSPKNICMLGEGAWGTAIATVLAANGHQVYLWCYDKDNVLVIQNTQKNSQYLPGIELSSLIHPTHDMQAAITDADYIFEAIPTKFLRSTITQAKPFTTAQQPWVLLSKGIEHDSHFLPSEILADVYGKKISCAMIAGPSFADEVAKQKMTGVVVAAQDRSVAHDVSNLLETSYFSTSLSTDLVGVQAAAAFKNIVALAIGIIDGAGYADNTKALMITNGLHEMARFVIALGGNAQTVSGLAGVGDLVLTCLGRLSRNLKAGQQLAHGKTLDEIEQQLGVLPEGINSVFSIHEIADKKKIKLPLCNAVYQIINQGTDIKEVLRQLFKEGFDNRNIF